MKNRLKIITAIMLTLIFCMQPVCNVQATEESNLSEAQQEKKTLENDLQKAKELPCVFNNWGVFYKGNFETVNLLLDVANLKRILKK
jgi:hypothetical protein